MSDDALLSFACPACGHAMKARASYAGRATRCPKCQASVTVPGQETPPVPAAKKSYARLFVAVGLLVLAGGLLAWMLAGRKDDIDDLALVPPNAQGVVCVKVDALWRTPAVQRAAEKYRRENPNNPDLARRMEAETGLRPEQVERVTVVVTNAARREGWAVVRTKEPYNAAAIQDRLRNGPMRDRDPEEPRPFFAAVSPRVFVLAEDDASVHHALDLVRSPEAPGRLTPVIDRCRQADHVVFGYNPAEDRSADNQLAGYLRAFEGADVFLGTLNVRKQAEVEVRAKTDSKAKAERLLVITTGWLGTAKTLLAFGQFAPGEEGKQAARFSKLLSDVKLAVDDEDLVATLKTDADAALAQMLELIP
jgi:hypothetical protein